MVTRCPSRLVKTAIRPKLRRYSTEKRDELDGRGRLKTGHRCPYGEVSDC